MNFAQKYFSHFTLLSNEIHLFQVQVITKKLVECLFGFNIVSENYFYTQKIVICFINEIDWLLMYICRIIVTHTNFIAYLSFTFPDAPFLHRSVVSYRVYIVVRKEGFKGCSWFVTLYCNFVFAEYMMYIMYESQLTLSWCIWCVWWILCIWCKLCIGSKLWIPQKWRLIKFMSYRK